MYNAHTAAIPSHSICTSGSILDNKFNISDNIRNIHGRDIKQSNNIRVSYTRCTEQKYVYKYVTSTECM